MDERFAVWNFMVVSWMGAHQAAREAVADISMKNRPRGVP